MTDVPASDAPVLPDWLTPVQEAAERITVRDLTRFLVPDGADPRRSAVLMLFGEGEHGPDVLLTERAHHMRSHPGQVSFPGGSLDPGETPVDAALREAWEETGLDPAGVHVFGQLPDLWLPPSNFAVTPVLGWWHAPSPIAVQSPDEVHAIYRVPVAQLREPERRITVRGPGGYRSPGFLIGDRRDVILWGFTGGVISRMFTFLGWLEDLPDAPEHELPAYMLAARPRAASEARPSPPADPDEPEEPQGP